MVGIDIINYTPEQFSVLSEEQLLEVKTAQLKKNRLLFQMEEELKKEQAALIGNGVYFSGFWDLKRAKIEAKYQAEIEWVRDSLLFYLHYSRGQNSAAAQAPYTVDYALSTEERLAIVRAYYEAEYADPEKRYRALKADTVAAEYLGEEYSPLLAYYWDLHVYG